MIFEKSDIEGVYLIKMEPIVDERGFFSRVYCKREFEGAGIREEFVQSNLCMSRDKGTIRGMHYQKYHPEGKLIGCMQGSVWDVCVDIRKDSDTYLEYRAFELTEDNHHMVYLPKGVAHGYLTLTENCLLIYYMSEFYVSGEEAGIRYNDPAIGIRWPIDNVRDIIISEKDKRWKLINKERQHEANL